MNRSLQSLGQLPFADPLCGPRCGAELKIIALIACLPKSRRRQERHQTDVMEKILRHCGLWEEAAARAPPSANVSVTG